jgi:Ca-activated chloride channel family protein
MKKLLYILLIIIFVMISGCTAKEAPDGAGAYEAAIDKLYNEDEALNMNIKYLAVDTTKMKNLTEESKKTFLKKLEKYGLTVLDTTSVELEKNGYIKDTNFEEGILFELEDEQMKNNTIKMDVSKFRSGMGAIGYEGMELKYRNGKWKIKKSGSPWIS